jgi:DNA-binding response OmpR family regulator
MQLNFSQVRAVVAEGNPMIRQGVRAALYNMGFREIIDTGLVTKAQEVCAAGGVDLLVLNSDLEGNDSALLVREMRRMKLGDDPFVVVMSILPLADEPHVRKVVDCGVDDMLLIPFSPEQMQVRMNNVITKRKPFVVTHDYIGPDRRKSLRAGAPAKQMPVPNPVVARASGISAERYRNMVEQASGAVRDQRMRSLAGFVKREGVELFAIGRDGEKLPDDLPYRMFRLETVVDELIDYGGSSTLDLSDFSRLCGQIKDAGARTGFRELEMLYQQTQALSARFGISSAA